MYDACLHVVTYSYGKLGHIAALSIGHITSLPSKLNYYTYMVHTTFSSSYASSVAAYLHIAIVSGITSMQIYIE